MQAWHTECANMLDDAASTPAESETAATPLSAPEAGYLFEGQLSQVIDFLALRSHQNTYLFSIQKGCRASMVLYVPVPASGSQALMC